MSTQEQLQATLKELENELATLDTLDEQSRQMLEGAMRDIEDALSKLNSRRQAAENLKAGDRDNAENQDLVGGLREAVERFESSHPTLTGILGRLADALAQLGI